VPELPLSPSFKPQAFWPNYGKLNEKYDSGLFFQVELLADFTMLGTFGCYGKKGGKEAGFSEKCGSKTP
jgi:hypothetical protein